MEDRKKVKFYSPVNRQLRSFNPTTNVKHPRGASDSSLDRIPTSQLIMYIFPGLHGFRILTHLSCKCPKEQTLWCAFHRNIGGSQQAKRFLTHLVSMHSGVHRCILSGLDSQSIPCSSFELIPNKNMN